MLSVSLTAEAWLKRSARLAGMEIWAPVWGLRPIHLQTIHHPRMPASGVGRVAAPIVPAGRRAENRTIPAKVV